MLYFRVTGKEYKRNSVRGIKRSTLLASHNRCGNVRDYVKRGWQDHLSEIQCKRVDKHPCQLCLDQNKKSFGGRK